MNDLNSIKIRRYHPSDEDYFDYAQYEMYKFEFWRDKQGSEEEKRVAYQEFLLSDPINHTADNHRVLIASTQENEPIGLIWIAERKPFWKYEDPLCWVYNLYVNPDVRNQGIASRLINEAIMWAKQRELGLIALHVADFNQPAIQLYDKLGFSLTDTHNWSCFYQKQL